MIETVTKELVMDVKLFDEAMKIPPRERVAFAELILASIEQEDEEIKKIWVSEVRDRMKSVQEGKSTLLDFSQRYAEDTRLIFPNSRIKSCLPLIMRK